MSKQLFYNALKEIKGVKMRNAQCPNCGGYKTHNSIDKASDIVGLGGSIVLFSVLAIAKKIKPKNSFVYNYTCDLCGYQWSWRDGTPWPKVTVRPDLIEKGNKRLEEERRRRD